MAELARTARGLATSVSGLERQFETYYPDDLAGADALRLLEQSGARTANARRTAEDLARTAAELERLGDLGPGLARSRRPKRAQPLARTVENFQRHQMVFGRGDRVGGHGQSSSARPWRQ